MNKQKRVFRTERIWLKPTKELRQLCHVSKNLYNEANYLVRQEYFDKTRWIKTKELQGLLKESKNYNSLPDVSSYKILKLVERSWKSFFQAIADWKKNPSRYYHQSRPPRYKRKDGEFLLPLGKQNFVYINGVIS